MKEHQHYKQLKDITTFDYFVIKKELVTYKKRIRQGLRDTIIFNIVLFSFSFLLTKEVILSLLFSSLSFVLQFLSLLKMNKTYIVLIKRDGDYILLEYFDHSEIKKEVFNENNLVIKKRFILNRSRVCFLALKSKDKDFYIRQYSIGYWKEVDIDNCANFFQKKD